VLREVFLSREDKAEQGRKRERGGSKEERERGRER